MRTTTRSRPVQWPLRKGDGAWPTRQPSAVFFAEGGFFTPDRKARFIAPETAGPEGSNVGGLSAAPQHWPHPRPVAHHDAIGP